MSIKKLSVHPLQLAVHIALRDRQTQTIVMAQMDRHTQQVGQQVARLAVVDLRMAQRHQVQVDRMARTGVIHRTRTK